MPNFIAGQAEIDFIGSPDIEGTRYKMYHDSLGKATIGIGHLIKPDENYYLTQILTPEEVWQLFFRDVAWNVNWLNDNCGWDEPMTRNNFTALLSFLHQYPILKLDYTHTRCAIQDGDRAKICYQLIQFINSKAGNGDGRLQRRRELEIKLFNTPD